MTCLIQVLAFFFFWLFSSLSCSQDVLWNQTVSPYLCCRESLGNGNSSYKGAFGLSIEVLHLFTSLTWVLVLSWRSWPEGHGGELGSSQLPLGQHFTAQLCYHDENEFPEPQVHPAGNKKPQRNTSNLPEDTILSSAFFVNLVLILIMFRMVDTVSALWIPVVTHVIHYYLNSLFQSLSETNVYLEFKIIL